MGEGGWDVVYHINGKEVTKEEWLQFQQNLENYKKQKKEEEELNMNNERHLNNHEEEVGENHDDNGDLQHEETFSKLHFPIRKPTGQAPMKNISP